MFPKYLCLDCFINVMDLLFNIYSHVVFLCSFLTMSCSLDCLPSALKYVAALVFIIF